MPGGTVLTAPDVSGLVPMPVNPPEESQSSSLFFKWLAAAAGFLGFRTANLIGKVLNFREDRNSSFPTSQMAVENPRNPGAPAKPLKTLWCLWDSSLGLPSEKEPRRRCRRTHGIMSPAVRTDAAQ